MNRICKYLSLALLCAYPVVGAAADLNVRGKVVQQGPGTPIEGVLIFNAENDKLLGSTNAYGEYDVTVDENATLLFAVLGCKDLEEPVSGRLQIDVALFPMPRACARWWSPEKIRTKVSNYPQPI